MKKDAQVVIVGGGLAGMTLGGLLAVQGVDCIIVDEGGGAGTDPRGGTDPRALAVTIASRRILEELDAWDRLPPERVGPIRCMHVWDENGQGDIHFDAADMCRPTLGYIIEQSVLQETLEQALGNFPALRFFRGRRPQALRYSGSCVGVELDQGVLYCDLVAAADGAASATRSLAGIDHHIHDYRQHALACVVETGLPHEGVARQRFLTGGPLAFLPMAGPRECGIVWSTTPQHAQQLQSMEKNDFHLVLQEAFESTLGKIVDSGPRASFPLRRAEASGYCRKRVALLGDAAHSIHPLAGQGANLGLLDAACLAQVLLEARARGRDFGDRGVLRRYERWRTGENRLMLRLMDGFKYLFENQSPPLPWLRNAGLDMVDAAAPVKHWIMRRAMGLEGDLPVLARSGC